MKNNSTSFLFFCFIVKAILFIWVSKAYSQKAVDSLYYYHNAINSPEDDQDLISAYNFFKKYKEQSLIERDTLKAIYGLRYIASIESTLGFPYESETTVLEALNLLNEVNSNEATIEARIGLYNHLGIISKGLLNYDDALNYYNKVLMLAQTPQQKSIVHNNKSIVYKELNRFDLAIDELIMAYENIEKLNNKVELARALDNLGITLSKINDPDGLIKMNQALTIRIEENDTKGLYSSYKHLTEYYLERNSKKEASYFASKAYDLAKSINSASYLVDALSYQMRLNDDPKVVEYKKLIDSINLRKQLSENKFALKKFDFAQYKRQAQISELNSQKEKANRQFFQVILCLIIALAVVVYLLLKSKYRKAKLQDVYDTETRISKKVHDEVANDMFQFMTKLQSEEHLNDNYIDDLERIYNKTRDISKEHSLLDMEGDFEDVLNDLILSYSNYETNIMVNGIAEIKWENVSEIKRTTIYKVLQELLINMRKHSKSSVVLFILKKERNKILINYSDNGVGCEFKKGTGLQNVENRIKAINGTIIFESEANKGFKVKMVV